jgi:protein-tyrosine phosphatase
MLDEGMVHFVATDAHGVDSRRPIMSEAFDQVCELVGEEISEQLCCHNPACVATGDDVQPGLVKVRRRSVAGWFGWGKAG